MTSGGIDGWRLALADRMGLDRTTTTLWRIETEQKPPPTTRVSRMVKSFLAEQNCRVTPA